jgi:hypothetical protein
MEQIGLPEYTPEEQEFAKKLQVTMGVKPTGMGDKMIPPFDDPPSWEAAQTLARSATLRRQWAFSFRPCLLDVVFIPGRLRPVTG